MTESNAQKSFSFYVSYWETAQKIPESERLAYLEALFAFIFDGEDRSEQLESDGNMFAYFAFLGCRPTLNTSKKRAVSGATKPTKNQTQIKTESNANQTGIKRESNGPKDKDKDKDKDKEEKERYGTFNNVLLTPSEFSNLKSKVSNPQDLIESMSSYLASSGKRYRSHYAALLNWARRDGLLVEEGAKPKRTAPHCKACGGLLTRFPEGLFCGNCGFVEEEGADDEPSTARPDG